MSGAFGTAGQTRTVRAPEELATLLFKDMASLERAAVQWVRTTAHKGLDEIIAAGQPGAYTIQIDGEARGSGASRRGHGFRPGRIDQATRSVRVNWIGRGLAEIANHCKPILLDVIAETFPASRRGILRARWSWWVEHRPEVGPASPPRRLGASVSASDLGIADVLWLVPDAPRPASYAWFALHSGIRGGGHAYNLRRSKKSRTLGYKLRKRLRGYLAEATARMRVGRAKQSGVTIQGWFVKKRLTGPATIARRGVPVVRVAYVHGLRRPVNT